MPDNGGSQIIGYVISILHSNGVTFSEEPIGCNGTNATIIA